MARSVRSVRASVRSWKAEGERVAFVPTMGFFHEGHLSLMRLARRRADRVVTSIYVNPTQFAPHEDYSRYPRDLDRDLRLARDVGVDCCFVPETLYREGHRTEVRVRELEGVLEGTSRPAHFAGVALVVLKLVHAVEPDLLFLGQKDAQQAVVLETMIADLDLPVRVARGRVVREPDGLAMSSRNIYLAPAERRGAPVLYRALRKGRDLALRGERSVSRVLAAARREIAAEPAARLDYLVLVDARTLAPLSRLRGRVLMPVAAFFGRTRLIDNVEFTVPGGGRRGGA